MWQYIRQLFQLLLAPSRGWEDISESIPSPDEVRRTGFFPWIGVTAASEFIRLFYGSGGFFSVLLSAIAIAGTLFVSMFIARIILDMTLPRYVNPKINFNKADIFVTYLMGLNGLYIIIANLLPASMTFTRFLPILSIVIMFKSAAYMSVNEDNLMTFLGLSVLAIIAVPIMLGMVLSLFI